MDLDAGLLTTPGIKIVGGIVPEFEEVGWFFLKDVDGDRAAGLDVSKTGANRMTGGADCRIDAFSVDSMSLYGRQKSNS
jgi:hypothetical protein